MERRSTFLLTAWLCAGACAAPATDPDGLSEKEARPSTQIAAPMGSVVPSCPLGAATYTTGLGLSNPQQELSLAVDPVGRAWVAGSNGVTGVTELSPSGAVLRALPFGSLVATNARGDVAFAGSFSSPIDLGLGLGTITPEGNVDVFVVVLDSRGKVVYARQLGLCGDGLNGLAIGRDERVAVSGSAMGTAILTPSGALAQVLAPYGAVAFDSRGNLAIAGGDAATSPFLRVVDPAGATLADLAFDGAGVLMTGVTVDPSDHVAFVGYTTDFIDLFGTTIVAQSSVESGRVTGAFLGEVDATWSPLRALDLGIVEANGVAAAGDGTLYIAGAETGNLGFDRITAIGRLPLSGPLTFINPTLVYGRDLSIGVDSCGNPLAAEIRVDITTPPSPVEAVVLKLPAP